MKRLAASLLLIGLAGASDRAAAEPKPPCKSQLSDCPKRGCAEAKTPEAYLNIQKRRRTAAGPLIRLTLADFRSLQGQAEQLFTGGHHRLSKPQRVRLRSLQIGGQTVGEGSLVEIIGFLAIRPKEPHANTSGESVNCRLTGRENNDIHINVTPAQDQSEWQGVVVEMVPQQRPGEWSETRLRNVQQNRRMVRVRGLLFFDNHHRVNDDEAHNISNQPKRFSLWEIHPVTKFDICTLNVCQADGPGWKPLED